MLQAARASLGELQLGKYRRGSAALVGNAEAVVGQKLFQKLLLIQHFQLLDPAEEKKGDAPRVVNERSENKGNSIALSKKNSSYTKT